MAWTFSGTFLDGFARERLVAGTGEPEELPGRYALAGLVDAHAHPTVDRDEHGPFLADGDYGAERLAQYAASGVTVIRDVGGRSEVTLEFARSTADGRPVVTAAGRFLAPANRYFPRMHSPVAPDELVAAIQAEVAAGAAWVKIIGDCPEWGPDGPMPESNSATYDLDTLRQAVDAAHAAGARVAVHNNLADSGLVAIGADSIEHGTGLSHPEIQALGARGGAWTPTLCAVLGNRDSPDPEVRKRTGERQERLRELLPYAVAHDVRILAGTDVVGTIAEEIALLVGHGLTVGQAITAAGSLAREFLGIHPDGDIVTYDDDPFQDPGVLARPAAVVVRGVRVRLSPRLPNVRRRLGRRRTGGHGSCESQPGPLEIKILIFPNGRGVTLICRLRRPLEAAQPGIMMDQKGQARAAACDTRGQHGDEDEGTAGRQQRAASQGRNPAGRGARVGAGRTA